MNDYLSAGGIRIYEDIKKHCEEKLKYITIDSLELGMLANSFDVYARAAKVCNEDGFANSHDQIRPEYSVMKTEYANILKHSAKFGLNHHDRDKILKNVKDDKKKGFDLTGKMKIAQ